ncbi:MAG: alanine dehydrogenase [Acidobacteria bacterium]|nr:alanine dehydrogenase [Acidobacteriota bacterium]
MNLGIPVEMSGDNRLALTPQSVELLVETGHSVFVEKDAGKRTHFFDERFEAAGAKILYSHEEVFGRSDVIVKSDQLNIQELEMIREEQILMGFHHLAVGNPKIVNRLVEQKTTVIGYELIEDEDGVLPILYPTSEIAGQMSVQVAAEYMKIAHGGKGILLGGIPGIPPAVMVVLGAGTVGRNACMAALGAGAQVIVLDKDIRKLREIERLFKKDAITAIATRKSIEEALALADVVIGAILIRGEKSPHIVNKAMLKKMKKGALIIDMSIDQGGCFETSRPTTPKSPVYTVDGIMHFCIPNIPSCVGRTGTLALNNVLYPYVQQLADMGIEEALKANPALRRGLYIYRGIPIHPVIEEMFGLKVKDIDSLL